MSWIINKNYYKLSSKQKIWLNLKKIQIPGMKRFFTKTWNWKKNYDWMKIIWNIKKAV